MWAPGEKIRSWAHCFGPAHTCHMSSASTPEQRCCTPPSAAPEQPHTLGQTYYTPHSRHNSYRKEKSYLMVWCGLQPLWSGTAEGHQWTKTPWGLWTGTQAADFDGNWGRGCCCWAETWQCRSEPGNTNTAVQEPEREIHKCYGLINSRLFAIGFKIRISSEIPSVRNIVLSKLVTKVHQVEKRISMFEWL